MEAVAMLIAWYITAAVVWSIRPTCCLRERYLDNNWPDGMKLDTDIHASQKITVIAQVQMLSS